MSLLSRLFGSRRPDDAPVDVEAQLEALEKEARNALPGYVGSAYNRAGDLALRHGLEGRALGYYGRAIDAFLEDAQREAARGVANKIIRVRPGAVRTLCTLTWLDLAARHQAMALLHLRDYAEAAREAEEQDRTATQIWRMARLSGDAQFLDAAADALDGLDFANRAEEVRGWKHGGGPDQAHDEGALANACVEAAVQSNDPDAALLTDDFEPSPSEDADAK
jgi:hypothetical protein